MNTWHNKYQSEEIHIDDRDPDVATFPDDAPSGAVARVQRRKWRLWINVRNGYIWIRKNSRENAWKKYSSVSVTDLPNGQVNINADPNGNENTIRPINELTALSGAIDPTSDKILLYDNSTGDHVYITPGILAAPEVFRNNGPLSGTAPVGYKVGIDYSTGTQYYVNTLGNWAAFPPGTSVVLTDLINGKLSINAGVGGVQDTIRPIDELSLLSGAVDFNLDKVALYDTSTGNHVYTTPLALNRLEIVSYAASVVFPTSPVSGDEFFVTSNGLSTGTILSSYIYNGTTWTLRPTGHSVIYGGAAPVTAGTITGQVYVQTSTGTNTGVLMNTWIWDGTLWYNEEQPINLTRAQLVILRNASQLRQSKHYLITDHVQGRLVAGTTILVHATADNEISENVTVNTTYDNEGWRGIYDIDRALVLELQDNRNNIARGINGAEVTNFDWGNINYTNVTVDNATLTVTYGSAAVITNVIIDKGSTVTLTGFTGTLNNINISIVSIVNLTNANGSWRFGSIIENSTLNATSYTGGGDSYYFEISDVSTVNISSSVTQVNIRTTDMHGMTINANNLAAGTGAITFLGCDMWQSTFTKGTGSGISSITRVMMRDTAIISHLTGTMTLNNVQCHAGNINQNTNAGATMSLTATHVKQGSNISNAATGALSMTQSTAEINAVVRRVAGATGTLTVNTSTIKSNSIVSQEATSTGNTTLTQCEILQGSVVYNRSAVTLGLTRVILNTIAIIETNAGSAGAINVTDTIASSGSTIRKNAGSTAGTLSVNSGTVLESSSFIQTSGTGNLTVNACNLSGFSGINLTAGDRSYSFTRLVQTGVSRANLSGTGAVTDGFSEVEMHYRGVLTVSCSGAANNMNYCNIEGLAGAVTLSGTTGNKTMNRLKFFDGSLSVNNNPNTATYQLWTVKDSGVVNIPAHADGLIVQYVDISNNSTLNVNKTTNNQISNIQISNQGTYNALTGALNATSVTVDQGVVTHNGGTISNISKRMQSTFTINGGTQYNVHHWSNTNKTTTVSNTSKADYLGLTSLAPIL